MKQDNFLIYFLILATFISVASVQGVYALTCETSDITFSQGFNMAENITVVINNNESIDLDNLVWDVVISPDYSPQIYNKFTSISSNSERTAIISINMSQYASSGKTQIGYILLHNANRSLQIPVYTNLDSYLQLDRIKAQTPLKDYSVNSGTVINIKPGETINMSAYLKNELTDIDDDMQNVVLTMIVQGMFGSNSNDESFQSETFSLDAGKSRKVLIPIEIPAYVNDGKYKVVVRASSTTSVKGDHSTETYFYIKVQRDKNSFEFNPMLYPGNISCSEKEARLYLKVRNVGSDPADNMRIDVKNSALNLAFEDTFMLSDNLDSSNNVYEKQLTLNFFNKTPGRYDLSIELYSDNDLITSQTLTANLLSCSNAANTADQSSSFVIIRANSTKTSADDNADVKTAKTTTLNPIVIFFVFDMITVSVLLVVAYLVLKKR